MATLSSDIAANQLALKLKLEPRLRREMSVVFATISKDMRTLYSTRGAVLNAGEFQLEINNILKQQYRRVIKTFGVALRRSIAKSFSCLEMKQIDDEVDAELLAFIVATTAIRSREIVATTQRDINKSIAKAIADSLTTDVIAVTDNVVIAEAAQKEFKLITRSRPLTISITETQTAAEGAKFIEATTVAQEAGAIANIPADQIARKEWVAVLDNRTRVAHVMADGLRVPVNQPFIVDGERLNNPGDTSLGATAGNIINCRCIAAYLINNVPAVEAIDSRIKPQTGRPNPTLEGVIGL